MLANQYVMRASLRSVRCLVRGLATRAETIAAARATPEMEAGTTSFEIKNPRMRTAILQGYDRYGGPPSLKSRSARIKYNAPIGLDGAFPIALDILKEHSKGLYSKAETLKQQLEEAKAAGEPAERIAELEKQINSTLVKAELDNPEVRYNFEIGQIDMNEPVYRHLAEEKWKAYDMLILMQRLETLKVIPDTLPTLDPRVHVELQFPGYVNKWVVPGEVLPCAVAARPPVLKVQEFTKIEKDSLYTVVVVDPDTPDLETDSYKTTLKWALANVPLSNTETVVDPEKATELISYLPPTPEKNTGKHRHAVWVFRQPDNKPIAAETAGALVQRDHFDIRTFATELGLDAVGAHLWRNKFDRSSEAVREKYGLEPGRVFARVRR